MTNNLGALTHPEWGPMLQSPGLDQGGTIPHSVHLPEPKDRAAGVGIPMFPGTLFTPWDQDHSFATPGYPRSDAGRFSEGVPGGWSKPQ